jgi:transcriptional regulator with XRE-family HTH domain
MGELDFAVALKSAMGGSMTQEELEDRSGVSQAQISKYLRGLTQPRYKQLVALERALPALRKIRHAA